MRDIIIKYTMHWEVLVEIMDSEVTGVALFSEGRSPEENSNYASHRSSIISASTSKRVHGIFDLYPTKELIKKSSYHWFLRSDLPLELSNLWTGADGNSRIFIHKCNAVQARVRRAHHIMTSDLGISKKYSEIDVTPYPFIFHGEIIFSHVTRSGPILARQI